MRITNIQSIFMLIGISLISFGLSAQDKKNEKDSTLSNILSGLKFRSIGPAFTSGRIIDFAVNPVKTSEYYVAVASGGVWKTNNAGITYNPVFDKQSSYSIGCVTIDPNNHNVVWVGTGENNSQRSVSYGDGVYKSEDGGKSWKNMGLKKSEHIAKIYIDPRNSKHVYVASQGPLWGAGGERGLYKTEDGGKTWKLILEISENTGVTDLVVDPRNPDLMYAASYQRRRHVWTLINGGPESAIYKSSDAGKSWVKIKGGIPEGELGRIGLAISPVNPDYIFALIEGRDKVGGLYKSTNRGASWEKASDYKTGSAQYYQEIVCDPFDADRIYSLDTWTKVSDDGGKTWKTLGNTHRHVDDHAFWADPKNHDHYLIGGDGGIYESYDRGKLWDYKANLPVTQFYRVSVDNDKPFYNVYGGTQDNNSMGGPSRTTNIAGITNADWFITNGGDGYETVIDPVDPNIVYTQSQYGYLNRFNKATGEKILIKPVEDKDDDAFRWNWNSPVIISPHYHKRLYFAANFLFRSDDQGNSWKKISPDLTRQIDRNQLKIMGKIQSVDAVAKNASTSQYGNIVSLTESPVSEDLIYIGTDDGLIQVTSDAGKNWKEISKIKGVPEMTYVSCLFASKHNGQTVYASFDNRKQADFKPYIFKSTDAGKSWKSIMGNLPENLPIHTIAEDHINPDLIFIGTEFGVYVTIDGGEEWNQLKAGLPTICVKDIAIQQRESDLVLGTFGRSFYILDDYSPLRDLSTELLKKEAHIFPIKEALMFIEERPLGGGGKSNQGGSYYTASNPPVGAVFTYYLKDTYKTRKQRRKDDEKKATEAGKEMRHPEWDELRAEDLEKAPYLLFTISGSDGEIVTRMKAAATKGIGRIAWNFRYAPITPVSLHKSETGRYSYPNHGMYALPGQYFVSLSKVVDNQITELVPRQAFTVESLESEYISIDDKIALAEFQKKLNKLRRVTQATLRIANQTGNKIKHIRVAVEASPKAGTELLEQIKKLEEEIIAINLILHGDNTKKSRNKNVPPTFYGRVESIIYGQWRTSGPPTETQKKSYRIALEEFEPLYTRLKTLVENDLKSIEAKLEAIEAPYTPGRFPVWEVE
ncbi:MAG: glycosyl hydrolase [Bacteroidota bacterium]|nr:glycosyl hydrolase [Bacteroidota bacterium]